MGGPGCLPAAGQGTGRRGGQWSVSHTNVRVRTARYPRPPDGQDTGHRREAIRGEEPRPGAAGPLQEDPGDKGEHYLEGPDHVISWAVGHLVQLADPDEYDEKFKKWRMADLPIVPDQFKLVVRDERSQEADERRQAACSGRDDVDHVVNACDAGREGELIFAYLYEKAGAQEARPAAVAELDDRRRDPRRPSRTLRAGEELRELEDAARSRSEADWIVGMNATRAATIRLRSSLRRRRVARPRADADAGDPRPPRGGDPRVRARALLARRRDLRGRRRARSTRAASTPAPSRACASAEEAAAIVEAVRGQQRRRSPSSRRPTRKERAPLLYDLTSLQREANTPLRLLRAAHARRRAALLRGAQGAHLSAYELALPDRRHGPRDQADRRAGRAPARVRAGRRST